tara:strand:- start:542 stop:1273 length:732 start_codon:yes stop_codon:yes gene_type:complete
MPINKIVALIPARSGSKRVKDKNILPIGSKNLINRAIEESLKVKLISATYIITDSKKYEKKAINYGAKSMGLRPENISTDTSSDIEWLIWALQKLETMDNNFTHYIILRPTNPFRTNITIKKAIEYYFNYSKNNTTTTLRSVKRVSEHPGKMWIKTSENYISRLIPFNNKLVPWSDCQNSTLPHIYIQNACIEIGSIRGILKENMPTSGFLTIPFTIEDIESFDINTQEDIDYARYIANTKGI